MLVCAPHFSAEKQRRQSRRKVSDSSSSSSFDLLMMYPSTSNSGKRGNIDVATLLSSLEPEQINHLNRPEGGVESGSPQLHRPTASPVEVLAIDHIRSTSPEVNSQNARWYLRISSAADLEILVREGVLLSMTGVREKSCPNTTPCIMMMVTTAMEKRSFVEVKTRNPLPEAAGLVAVASGAVLHRATCLPRA